MVVGSGALLGRFPGAWETRARCFKLIEQEGDVESSRRRVEKNGAPVCEPNIQMVEWRSPPAALLDHIVAEDFVGLDGAGCIRNCREPFDRGNANFHVT